MIIFIFLYIYIKRINTYVIYLHIFLKHRLLFSSKKVYKKNIKIKKVSFIRILKINIDKLNKKIKTIYLYEKKVLYEKYCIAPQQEYDYN